GFDRRREHEGPVYAEAARVPGNSGNLCAVVARAARSASVVHDPGVPGDQGPGGVIEKGLNSENFLGVCLKSDASIIPFAAASRAVMAGSPNSDSANLQSELCSSCVWSTKPFLAKGLTTRQGTRNPRPR